jgi:hypothetical protein
MIVNLWLNAGQETQNQYIFAIIDLLRHIAICINIVIGNLVRQKSFFIETSRVNEEAQ